MKKVVRAFLLPIILLTLGQAVSVTAQEAASNPATDKFKEDLKAAVLNGSITVPQVKELQANAETLKAAKAEQQPGAPIDLLTPYRAVTNMRAIMATVNPKDRQTLQEDMQAILASKKPDTSTAEPPSPGKKLGKDIFVAVMFGQPTESQVQQLQDSLNALQQAKGESSHPLQALMALKKSKGEIEAVMNAGSFRNQDRQAVLDDLNNLGPQGGAMQRRG